jgi:hypothetical protein
MDAKRESERLMNALLPFAEKMLRQYGEFYPYGGYVKPDGSIVDVGASDEETDHPKSRDLIYVLRSSLREIAVSGECRATAVLFDVKVTLPQSDEKSDAIQLCIDHAEGYSVEVFVPYRIIGKDVVFGDIFAQAGKHEVF